MRKKTNKSEEVQEVKQKRRKQNKENEELTKGIQIANKAVQKENKQRKKRLEQEDMDSKIAKPVKSILVIIIIVLIVVLFKYRHIIGITFSKDVTESDSIVIDIATSDNKVYAYQNELLMYSKGSLTTYSRYGKKTWEYTFDETFIPEINTAGKYIQVVNKDNGYVYVFENKYESSRKKIEGKIKLASINEKGQSVIHYSKEGVKSDIGIFDKKGNEQYEVTLKTENIANVLLSKNGRYLLMYEVETGGISVNSILKIVDLKKSQKVKTLLEIENDIIYDVELTNSKVMALTSSKVYTCNIAKESKRELNITNKNISNISIDKSGISYIYKEIADEENTVEFLNNRYNIIGTYKFKDSIKHFIYHNSLAYVIQNKEINIYNRWGMHIKKYNSNSIITNPIIFNDGKNIAVVYSNKIVVIGI